MKTSIKILALALLTSVSVLVTSVSKSQVSASITFSTFHDNLSAYGRWVNHAGYGQIWICNEAGFRPYYSGGHWAYTEYGWTWVSDYPWGWAPFHYGRWAHENDYGWFWVPGYEWGPAWVNWRTGGDYYGWSPLSPGVRIGVSFGMNVPAERWVFVPHRYITSPSINRHYVNNRRNVTIIRNTTVINNTHVTNVSNRHVTYFAGPGKADVEKVTRKKVETMTIQNASRPGTATVNRNTINIYKPQVDKKSIEKNVHITNVNSNNKTVNSNNKVKKNAAISKQSTTKNQKINSNNRSITKNKMGANTNNANKRKPGTNAAKSKSNKKQNEDVVYNKKHPKPNDEK